MAKVKLTDAARQLRKYLKDYKNTGGRCSSDRVIKTLLALEAIGASGAIDEVLKPLGEYLGMVVGDELTIPAELVLRRFDKAAASPAFFQGLVDGARECLVVNRADVLLKVPEILNTFGVQVEDFDDQAQWLGVLETLVQRLEHVAPANRLATIQGICDDPRLARLRPRVSKLPEASAAARGSSMPGYSETPLLQKLGIKSGCRYALLNAPVDFQRDVGEFPDGLMFRLRGKPLDVILLFTIRRADLAKRFADVAERLTPAGGLWVCWPKKASGVPTDLTENVIREIGLQAGLVDNKVCAVDDTWSGLRFVYRLKDRPKK